jgi:hypothetical protein
MRPRLWIKKKGARPGSQAPGEGHCKQEPFERVLNLNPSNKIGVKFSAILNFATVAVADILPGCNLLHRFGRYRYKLEATRTIKLAFKKLLDFFHPRAFGIGRRFQTFIVVLKLNAEKCDSTRSRRVLSE